MNDFIGGNYNQTEEQQNAKKWIKIIAIILAFLLVVVFALIGLMYYLQLIEFKTNLDGKVNKKVANALILEDNQIYIPIRDFALYMNYTSGNGDYKQYSEDTTKCYVQSSNEIASFSLGSNKIYKILLDDKNNDYEYYEIEEPVKMINDKLCTTIEGAEIAFNIQMSYNKEKNQVDIFTLPYLVTYYTSRFQNAGIADKDASFSNQKALLYNMIVLKDGNANYGVYSLTGEEILGIKYANVKFVESTKEFIVTTPENKMGIISCEYSNDKMISKNKINPEYDDIKQIDRDLGLYLVTNNQKQGVINENGSIVVYLEYDQIGVDGTKFINNFTNNEIKNQYIFYNNCIPVKRNNLWGFFDKAGKKLTEIKYTDVGCSAKNGNNGDKNVNSILLIPSYEAIVVQQNDKYGLINSQGKDLIPVSLQSFYFTTTSGKDVYEMVYNDQVMNVVSYIEKYVKPKQKVVTENVKPTETTEKTKESEDKTTDSKANTETKTKTNTTTNTNTNTNTTTKTNTTEKRQEVVNGQVSKKAQ